MYKILRHVCKFHGYDKLVPVRQGSCSMLTRKRFPLLNQVYAGYRPACSWFLVIDLICEVCVCVYVRVCPLLRLVITSAVMWHDMDPTYITD